MCTTIQTGARRVPRTEPVRQAPRGARTPAGPGGRPALLSAVLIAVLGLAGCAGTPDSGDGHGGAGVHGGAVEGPPDAVPRAEPKSKYGNMDSYVVFGKRYYTKASSRGHVERGIASWYGHPFHGRKTSSGEVYDMHQMTAAHKTLPLPTYARVTNLENGRSAVVKINDRGPFSGERVIDLSYAAARRLDLLQKGTGRVEIVSVDPRDNYGVPPGMMLASAEGPAPAAPVRGSSRPEPALASRATPAPRREVAAEPVLAAVPKPAAPKPSTPAPAEAVAAAPKPVVAAATPPKPAAPKPVVAAATPPRPAAPKPVVAAATPPKPAAPAPTVIAARAPAQPVASRPAVHKGTKASAQPAVYLQVGAFGSRGNAEALKKRLGGRLPEPVKVHAPAAAATGALYKVQVGPVPSSRAEALRRELTALGLERPITIRQ